MSASFISSQIVIATKLYLSSVMFVYVSVCNSRIVIDPNVDFSRGGGGLLRSGSKFRYTGRTEFQVRQSMRAVSRDEPRFTRYV